MNFPLHLLGSARLSFGRLFLLGLLLIALNNSSCARPIREAIREHRIEKWKTALKEEDDENNPSRVLPEGVTLTRDLAYGSASLQQLDVYWPAASTEPAPILFMVHGGAWKFGDKRAASVVDNKVRRWVTQGFVLVSINYRMLPDANPLEQADDVARALAYVQQHAAEYHGDPTRVILMGHSAGAHLVSFISAHPDLAAKQGAKPWLGTVSLDSAAFDVVEIMQHRHFKLYDEAFGKDEAFWKSASPYHVLTKPVPPILAVCSSRRDDSTKQAKQFAARAKQIGSPVTVHAEDLTHAEINKKLGEPGAYTDAVEAFLRTLDPVVAKKLGKREIL